MRFKGITCVIATLTAAVTFIPHVRAMVKSPLFFKTPIHFRNWLIEHHTSAAELMVGFHKIGSGVPSMTWSESVDEALCFGWIDSVRRRLDDTSYVQRFSPRRPGSIWSVVNVAKVEALTSSGRMQAAGLAAYAARRSSRTGIYSFEREQPAVLSSAEMDDFRSSEVAWQYFDAAAPSYKRSVTHWVVSAKRTLTRARRLSQLITACEEHRRLTRL